MSLARPRRSDADDAATLARLRCAFLREIGQVLPDGFEGRIRSVLSEALADGRVMCWQVDSAGDGIATASAHRFWRLPTPANPEGHGWHVLNVYVRPDCRRRGMAHQLMRSVLAEARRQRVGLIQLNATAAAWGLYRALGFQPSRNLLELRLPVARVGA